MNRFLRRNFCGGERIVRAVRAAPALDKQVGTNLANSGKKLTNIKIHAGLIRDKGFLPAILPGSKPVCERRVVSRRVGAKMQDCNAPRGT